MCFGGLQARKHYPQTKTRLTLKSLYGPTLVLLASVAIDCCQHCDILALWHLNVSDNYRIRLNWLWMQFYGTKLQGDRILNYYIEYSIII